MNKVILVGRLARDPETRTTNSEKATTVANFTIAVDRPRKREGQPSADFMRCTAFGPTADFVSKYMKKGMRVALSGHIQTGSYEKDGVKHSTTDIIIEDIEFAQSKSENTAPAADEAPADGFAEADPDEELPFN